MKIKLMKGRAIVSDREIQTIAHNEPFTVDIESETPYSDLYAVCIIGGKKHPFKIKDGKLIIESKYLRSGEMLMTISQVKDGKTLNSWICERITFKEIEGSYEPIPEIVELRKDIADIRALLEETKEFYRGICEGYNII